jgi:hypothetical protein
VKPTRYCSPIIAGLWCGSNNKKVISGTYNFQKKSKYLRRKKTMTHTKDIQEIAVAFSNMLLDVQKKVSIRIALKDLENLKKARYKLCFAKKIGNKGYNVVWQSYSDYLTNNTFSWTPQYALFGSNTFQDNIQVRVSTNIVAIGLGETSILNRYGVLKKPTTGGPITGLTMDNRYGSIHPGIKQLSTGIDGKVVSKPIYVSENPIVKGEVFLRPVEKILVWFEQYIRTGTMFSTSRSREVEIDLTFQNTAAWKYKDQKWIKI